MSNLVGWRNLCGYGVAVVLTLAILFVELGLWHADLRIPFEYNGDTLYILMKIKVMEESSAQEISRLNAPCGIEGKFGPDKIFAGTTTTIIRGMVSLFDDVGLVVNLFFLLMFPVIVVSSMIVMGKLGFSAGIAMVIGILYAFLPYHFFRGEAHSNLAAYFMVPVSVWIAIRLAGDQPVVWRNRSALGRWCYAGLALLIAGDQYYAFFSCYFFVIAALYVAWTRRSFERTVDAGILMAVIAAGVILPFMFNPMFFSQTGRNVQFMCRMPQESEFFALKLTQMLLPVWDWPILQNAAQKYAQTAPFVNENRSAALGLLGGIGFLLLLLSLISVPPWLRRRSVLLKKLAVFNIAGVLLGIGGGLGTLFAYLVSPQIRSYNRISIFIAFFSLVAVGCVLEKLREELGRRFPRRLVWIGSLVLILGIGLFGQYTVRFIPDYGRIARQWNREHNAFAKLEGVHRSMKTYDTFAEKYRTLTTNCQMFTLAGGPAAMEPGAMIYQYPHCPYPEGCLPGIGSYDYAKPFLHTKNLRWSFGAIRGRNDTFHLQFAGMSPQRIMRRLALAGFSGVLIDRRAFRDNGENVVSAISKEINREPYDLARTDYLFFDLRPYAAALKASFDPQALSNAVKAVLNPVLTKWGGSFYDSEDDGASYSHWCGYGTGVVELINAQNHIRDARLKMKVHTGPPDKSLLHLTGVLTSDVPISGTLTTLVEVVRLRPGTNCLFFRCDGKAADIPFATRNLVFRVMDFNVDE